MKSGVSEIAPLISLSSGFPKEHCSLRIIGKTEGYTFLHKVFERFKLRPFAYQGIEGNYLVKQAGPCGGVLPLCVLGILVWQS